MQGPYNKLITMFAHCDCTLPVNSRGNPHEKPNDAEITCVAVSTGPVRWTVTR